MQSAFACGTLAILCCFIWPAFAPSKNHVNPYKGIVTAVAGVGGTSTGAMHRCVVCTPESPGCSRSTEFCARMLNGGKGKCKCYPKPVPPEATVEATKERDRQKGLAYYKEEMDSLGELDWVKITGTGEIAAAVNDHKPLPAGSEAIRADFGFICWSKLNKLVDGEWPGVERCT